MGFFNFLKRGREPAHKLTDEDREKAAELNRARFEARRAEIQRQDELNTLRAKKEVIRIERDIAKYQEEINELIGEDDDEDGDNATEMLTGLFSKIIQANAPQAGGQIFSNPPPPATPQIHLTDEELLDIYRQVPKRYLKLASAVSDDNLKQFILQKVGNADEDTLNRAVELIRKG